jgi:hypothetical protein
MTDNRTPDDRQNLTTEGAKAKKPYMKPAFRHERVFETTALVCGKTSPIQQNCITSRKTS